MSFVAEWLGSYELGLWGESGKLKSRLRVVDLKGEKFVGNLKD
jgi:hypothetical protein